MTTYSAIADSEIDTDSPLTTSLMTKMRDNPLSMAQGDASSPRINVQSLGYQKFTSSGTFSVPSHVSRVYVRGKAGGGGGNNGTVSMGGGAGGEFEGWVTVTPGSTVTVTIGAGGTSNNPGSNGGTTSFGSLASATGGKGGGTNLGQGGVGSGPLMCRHGAYGYGNEGGRGSGGPGGWTGSGTVQAGDGGPLYGNGYRGELEVWY